MVSKKLIAVVVGVPAAAIVPWVLWWGRMPSEVATHWDLGGDANGHMARPAAFALLAGLATALAVSGVLLTHHELSAPGDRFMAAGPVLGFVGSVIAGASLGTVVANIDAARWQDASLPLGVVGLGLLGGVAVAIAMRVPASPAPDRTTGGPAIAIAPGERVAWVGSARSTVMLATAAAMALAGAGLLLFAIAPAGPIVLFVALVVADVSSVRAVAGNDGIRLHAAMGWPRVHIDAARIVDAEAIDVDPWKWGGWGYRGSLALFGRAAWVVRRGAGLKLSLADSKVFVVTVDHADEVAAVLRGLTSTRR